MKPIQHFTPVASSDAAYPAAVRGFECAMVTLTSGQRHTAEYTAELAQTLAAMARDSGLGQLADILDLAALEAGIMVQTGIGRPLRNAA